jgi:HPt (histidine-containing phosphotransfer) domain-containing protein
LSSDKKKCIEAGMNGHVGKPFELINLVQEILNLTQKPAAFLSHHTVSRKPVDAVSRKAVDVKAIDLNDEPPYKLSRQELVILKQKTKINIQESLQRFSGSEDLYIQSLSLFVADLERYIFTLGGYDKVLVIEEIKAIFHTLKGTAGLLGFTDLSDLALESEQLATMLVDKGASVEPLYSLVQLMKNVKSLIESIFEASNSEVVGVSSERHSLDAQKMAELRAQLENSNMQAVELYKTLKESISEFSSTLAPILEAHICNLQFKEALSVLGQLEHQFLECSNG